MRARSSPAISARELPCKSEVKSSPLSRASPSKRASPRKRLARFHTNTSYVNSGRHQLSSELRLVQQDEIQTRKHLKIHSCRHPLMDGRHLRSNPSGPLSKINPMQHECNCLSRKKILNFDNFGVSDSSLDNLVRIEYTRTKIHRTIPQGILDPLSKISIWFFSFL